MDTILVTGGAGFIGSNFVWVAIRATSAKVVVYDKLTYAGSLLNLRGLEQSNRFAFVRGDICDRLAVLTELRKHRPRAIVHFAAESHVDRSIDGPRNFLEANVCGTFELLDAALAHFRTLDDHEAARFRFLHVSTDEVYGSLGATGRFHENSRYEPNSPYAASKAASDHFVRAFHQTYKLPTLITNSSNNYGYYQFPEKLVPMIVLNALSGRPLPIYGDGRNVRDWLFVEDHCEALLAVLERGQVGENYNIGGDTERTTIEMVDAICDTLEAERPAAANPVLRESGIKNYCDLKMLVSDRPGHDRRYSTDITKIRQHLNWRPRFRFEDALRMTINWYLANGDWCSAVQRGNYDRRRLGLLPAQGAHAGGNRP
jgi:dTDP-glucose 4,6-dehydratase